MNSNWLNFFNGFFDQKIWLVVKGAIIVGLVFYLGFALMIVRQVGLMSKTLKEKLEGPLKLWAWLYFLAVVGTLLISILVL